MATKPANTASRQAAKRIEFLLYIFDLLTTDGFMNLGSRHAATTQRILLQAWALSLSARSFPAIRRHKNILYKSFEGSRSGVLRRTRLQRNENSCVDGFVHLDVHGSPLRRDTQLRQRLLHLVIRELLVT